VPIFWSSKYTMMMIYLTGSVLLVITGRKICDNFCRKSYRRGVHVVCIGDKPCTRNSVY